jgi:uncharacterized oxidoreductase
MVAGDPERKARAERTANGIPIDGETWRQIVEAAAKLGLAEQEVNGITAG